MEIKAMSEKKITIYSDSIKLDQILKLINLVGSGGEAKILIEAGKISVNEEIETRRGRKLFPGDRVQIGEDKFSVKKESPE